MTAVVDRTTVVLPVGTPGGVRGERGLVRLGGSFVELDVDTYRLWRVAAAATGDDGLAAWAADHDVPEVDERRARLETSGLLVRATSTGLPLDGLVARVLGECLDGTPPELVLEGRAGSRWRVSGPVFDVLLRADDTQALADLCATVDAGGALADGTTAALLSAALPSLVRSEVVLLDRVRP